MPGEERHPDAQRQQQHPSNGPATEHDLDAPERTG